MSLRLSALAALALAAPQGLPGADFAGFMSGVHIKKSGKDRGLPGRAYRSRNKFKPEQSGTGAQECARRRRQQARLAAKAAA